MHTISDLRFIRDRVIKEWVTDRVPIGPFIWPKRRGPAPSETCRRGHTGQRGKDRRCLQCKRDRRARR